jgi:hypothetical protein
VNRGVVVVAVAAATLAGSVTAQSVGARHHVVLTKLYLGTKRVSVLYPDPAASGFVVPFR